MVINRIKTGLWALLISILVGVLIFVNIRDYSHRPPSNTIPELPIKEIELPNPAVKMDVEYKARIAAQQQWLQEAKDWQFWGKDIKRELHSMRAEAKIFAQMRRDAALKKRAEEKAERIRIAKEKAEKRKLLKEQKAKNAKIHKTKKSD